MRNTIILFVTLSFFGCKKESSLSTIKEAERQGELVERVVEGTVFEDCAGNVSVGKQIFLYYTESGCFGANTISVESTTTDNTGHFVFHYNEFIPAYYSTTSYFHTLSIPNTTINLCNPVGNFELYPNESKMNAVINLRFHNSYTSNDTFYYQCSETSGGYVQNQQALGYFTGPFHDTTLVLNALSIGNSNGNDRGKNYSGFFKWSIGIVDLGRYYTGHDGSFDFTHQPCAATDTFEYYADPM